MATVPTSTPPAAAPPPADPNFVNVEVDGVPLKARKGAMIIHVTDANNAYVPRFCYHDKLPVAANCRMCLVEVEKAPKPLPACATPVSEGMKIFTRSPNAIAAQKATMEFLLINHPLDCPICDQGGECELQDLAMGFGRDVSRFAERKRVVKDKNLGPLVSTDMTRCIHCTRCVRFGQDVAGIQELGTTGRGEHMEIGTYIERSVDHELSGNIIDLCPVGALNSKPFRYRGRSWEMTQHALVAPHDGVGSNLFGHVIRGKLMRIVPRQNEAINETWISDRDRFSYEGIYAADRLQAPMIRDGEQWRAVGWPEALESAARLLQQQRASLGTLVSASATTEEQYLAARLTRGLGSANIDHRLRQQDFRDAAADPVHPHLGMSIAAVDHLDGLLLIGSHLRHELPILAHRVRKAARRGGKVAMLNPQRFEWLFPVAAEHVVAAEALVPELACVLLAAAEQGTVPQRVQPLVATLEAQRTKVTERHRALARVLQSGEQRAVWLGALAIRDSRYAELRVLASAIAQCTGAQLGILAEGGNAAGAALAGALPHRAPGGANAAAIGQTAGEMLRSPLGAYLLVGALEPWRESALPQARATLAAAKAVVAITPFADETLKSIAHVLLPMGTFAESSGTFINLEGHWQSFAGAARLLGEARPGWKVLRVLANSLGLAGFDYDSSEAVRTELRALCPAGAPAALVSDQRVDAGAAARVAAAAPLALYDSDALVRRAPALQLTRTARGAEAGAS